MDEIIHDLNIRLSTNQAKAKLKQELETTKNRPDKTILNIHSMHPEKLLAADIAHPKQVKHLTLDLSFDICDDYDELEENLYKTDCDCPYVAYCNKCSWGAKYRETLCKDLVNFDQLETVEFIDVNLSNELWIEFAQNSKCLKEITFDSHGDLDSGCDLFAFCGRNSFYSPESRDGGLDAIVKIPTLEKIKFSCLELQYFPPGPSNLKHIELDQVFYNVNFFNNLQKYKDKLLEFSNSYANNFSTHTNLTSVDISEQEKSPFTFSSLQLEKLEKLEKLEYSPKVGVPFNDEDFECLKVILKLPKFSELKLCV